MNRTDRLLAVVLELQGKGWQRAEDLAATFECSRRTIYRDLLALGEAGVPVVSMPGRGYSLMEGYFLPPLSFSTDEATMLLLGSDFMAQHFDAQYRAAAQSAGRKITGVLPEKLRAEVRELRESIHFVGEGVSAHPLEAAKLQTLRRAILARQTVRFRYTTRYGTSGPRQPHVREADPYALVNAGGAWLLAAYCHLRRGVRNFRLDRMDDVSVLEATFTRPAAFQAERRNLFEPGSFDVRILFAPEAARWVRETPSFFTIAQEETPDGGLRVTLHVRHESEILQWLLGWGRHAHVLEPEMLRERLAQEADAMLAHYVSQPMR
ncbi:MAG TPA: YafY family protein [Ktedonobacterales bacterium]|nr:YafY family protein [Ktedonobacterales bacterium]